MARTEPVANQAGVVLVYVLLVLGGSVGGGRTLGFAIAIAGSIAIDYYFQWPFNELGVARGVDVAVLLTFLATALVATQLLAAQQAEAKRALERAQEIERLLVTVQHTEALREANRMKDVLLASVSHDLRTPLSTIKALAQDVQYGADSPANNAAIIVQQAERLERLVGDLLDLSRLKTGGFTINPELNAAEDLIGATVQQFVSPEHATRIETVIDYSQPALLGMFDFVQTLRVLTNLVDNALRYSPSPSPVKIRVTRSDNMICFSVEDQGPGLNEGDEERIFEPFFRSTAKTPDAVANGTGTGLGLSIAHRIATAHGGSLQYRKGEGGGATFTVRLPAAEA